MRSLEAAGALRLVGYVGSPGPGHGGWAREREHRLQESALRAWAREAGHHLAVVAHERGAIRPVAERPALQRALVAIAQRRAAGLLVERLDTLDQSVAAQEAILALIWWHGGRVLTTQADSPERAADEARRQLRQMAGFLLRLERGLRSARARAALRRVREQGGHSGGAPAFGFQVVAGRLTEDAAEQAALDRIAELRRVGRSLREIARTLDEEGHRPKRGDRWHPETVRRILARLAVEGPEGTGPPR